MNDDNVYPLFRAPERPQIIEEADSDWPTSCLERIDEVLSDRTVPYGKMIAEICTIMDEWKLGQ